LARQHAPLPPAGRHRFPQPLQHRSLISQPPWIASTMSGAGSASLRIRLTYDLLILFTSAISVTVV
jgi:hypothetical protein